MSKISLEKIKPSDSIAGESLTALSNQTKVCSTNVMQESSSSKLTKRIRCKKRNWAFVIYPESLPKNWLEILQKTGLPIAISPLHDKDVEADGVTPKKAHYHVICTYSGPTSFDVVKRLTDALHAPQPIPLEAVKGYYRYLTHKDNPEKYQYSEKDIRTLNGFNILDFVELAKSEVLAIKRILQKLIREKGFREYSYFLDYVEENRSDNEYDVASSNTYFFHTYISSLRNAEKNQVKKPLTEEQENEVKELVKKITEDR